MSQILIFNQGVGPLFRELVTAIAENFGPVTLYTLSKEPSTELLRIAPMPKYDNTSGRTRLLSWTKYLLRAAMVALTEKNASSLFIVTNPPFAPLVGLIANKIQRRPYFLLFYDIYPEALVRFAGVAESNPIVQIWRHLNRIAIRDATCVVTISTDLAGTLSQYFPSRAVALESIHIVPTWVNTELIRPI
jgi:hypothetical protein